MIFTNNNGLLSQPYNPRIYIKYIERVIYLLLLLLLLLLSVLLLVLVLVL